ncbi:MAG: sugar ABC transporter permease [Bacteroidales bacterium]|nr:sugar ABC transporter permease [Lachnoclostridium sp.]MCM1383254.1 sugar ABC transporter permease [Lachnoclostridium sp.]MCM1465742.1 sugar ABC transporter permease [Bacteroidales bacterium]
MNKGKSGWKVFFATIGGFFKNFGRSVVKGDIFVKLSLLWMGAGYIRRKQFIKGILMTLFEVVVIWYSVVFAGEYVSKFHTLGTVQQESIFNIVTMKNEFNDYDDSFMILLFSVFSLVVWAVSLAVWMYNVTVCYRLQQKAQAGEHINTFKEDIRALVNEKFHITLLALPVAGVVLFTIVPLFVLIAVAFTNYDQQHMPPSALFTWVGFQNFKNLFSGSLTVSFGYAFRKILVWTLVWAVFATITTYLGGILLSLLLNSKYTKLPKMWRTLFVATIAVPQFVSLLLVRNFFANNGIMNTICESIGLTGWLRSIGAVGTSYIPFLSAPVWAHVMIILINIWIGVPYQMLIATGVLMNIPVDQLESARIDGATPAQTFRHITMPYMLFVTGPALVTDFVKNINNFNVIYLLTQDVYVTTDQMMANAQGKETDLLITWLFNLTQNYYNYKMASAIGIIVFIICAAFTLVAFNRFLKGDREEAYR